jgi:small subunit ribosomal protein S8
MTVTDPIADLLTRIRNGMGAQHRYIDVGWSKIKEQVARVLKEEGFIESYFIRKEGSIGTLRMVLRYHKAKGVSASKQQEPVIKGLKRASTPGRRLYVQKQEIPYVLGGLGISILTTSKGVMTGQKAKASGVGGELLCKVW